MLSGRQVTREPLKRAKRVGICAKTEDGAPLVGLDMSLFCKMKGAGGPPPFEDRA
jgi:hypothetical protein